MSSNTKKETRKQTREIHDYFKNPSAGESYSNVDPEKFYDYADIDITELLATIYKIPPRDQENLFTENLFTVLSMNYHSEGTPESGNETKKSDFVQPILSALVAYHKRILHMNIILKREGRINSSHAVGEVEFVVKQGSKILIVVEAKKDDWDQGRAQNMLELISAHSVNVKENGKDPRHTVYGAVTTGVIWEIFSYTSTSEDFLGTWKFHGKFTVLELTNDPNSIEVFERRRISELLSIMNSILSETYEY